MSFNDDEYAAAILAQKFGSAECPLSKSPSGTTNQSTAPNPLTNTPFLAKLQSQNGHCHYITTAVVKLGRKSTSIHEAIDVDLGDGKCISRKHAEIAYSYVSNGFMLTVFGKNGVFVDDKHVPKGASVPLRHGSKLKISDREFHFVLPTGEGMNDNDSAYRSTSSTSSDDGEQTQDEEITIPVRSSVKRPKKANNRPGESLDDYKNTNIKPPFSYATLIAQAINSTEARKMTLNGIYNHIMNNYPYYKNQLNSSGWQNSIRHNLSLNKAFIRVPREENDPGKGAFWAIDPAHEHQFESGVYRTKRRNTVIDRRRSSFPDNTSKYPHPASNLNPGSHKNLAQHPPPLHHSQMSISNELPPQS